MKIEEIIGSLLDQIDDRESLIPPDDPDSIFKHDAEALREAGIAYAIDQIVDLVTDGVDGIHLYTMNNPYVARKISEAVGGIIKAAPKC